MSFDVSSEDEDFQLSYTEFIKSIGTDTTPWESDEMKKKRKFEAKKSSLDELFSEDDE
jgi:hypothetical protein